MDDIFKGRLGESMVDYILRNSGIKAVFQTGLLDGRKRLMKYEEKAKIKFSPYFFHADTTELNGIPTPDFAIITENRKFSFVEVKFRRLDLDNSIELFTREAEKIVDIWDCYVVLITKDLLLDLAMEYNYFTVFNKVASGSNGYEVGSLLKHEDWKINKEAVKECEEIIKKINFD